MAQHSTTDRRSRPRALAAAPAAALALAGCAQTPAGGPPGSVPAAEERRQAERIDPREPVQLTMNVGQPLLDSDGNGFPDSMEVWVYLFPSERYSRLPVWSAGSFEFRLRAADGSLLGAWDIPAESAAAFRQQFAPGPGYVFGLALAEGEDAMPRVTANLFLTFVTPSGRRVSSRGPATLTLGG